LSSKRKQVTQEQLSEYLQPVWDETQELTTIDYDYADGKTKDKDNLM
jgi:hypothetical protein